VHDRPDVTRVEKMRFLARHPVALERLKVCINQSADRNCGRCGKCVRTMIGFEVAGALDRTHAFDEPLRLWRVLRLRAWFELERALHHELLDEVRRAGGRRRLRLALRFASAYGWVRGRIWLARRRRR
jgi:hypothetical protein